MGYSASMISGPAITVTREQRDQLWEVLVTGEPTSGPYEHGYSWAGMMADYRDDDRLLRFLSDAGFDLDVDGDDYLVSWGGDKLGSTFDVLCDALATVVTERVEWIMVGEDDSVWAEVFVDGRHFSANVRLTVVDPGGALPAPDPPRRWVVERTGPTRERWNMMLLQSYATANEAAQEMYAWRNGSEPLWRWRIRQLDPGEEP